MNHGLRLAVLAKQIGVAIVRNVVCGRRRVDEQYVSGICKVEYAFHVLRVQLAYFVHHAMYAEIAELATYLSFGMTSDCSSVSSRRAYTYSSAYAYVIVGT